MRRLALVSSVVVVLPAAIVFAACTSSTTTGGSGGASSSTTTSATTTTGSTTSSSTTTTTTTSSSTGGVGGGAGDAGDDAPPVDSDASIVNPCTLPGSVQFTSTGTVVVPGGVPGDPSLSFLHLPVGFCAHYFGTVGNARQLRFAPGGELFVASPITGTTGGGQNGVSAIVVLPDDNHDGRADANLTFMGSLPATQGLMFTPGYFYYQTGRPCTQATVSTDCVSTGTCSSGVCEDGTRIMRVPYAVGDRTPSAASEQMADITYNADSLHWPRTMDMADDGSIYVANGGSQSDQCITPHPFKGGIRKIDGTLNGAPIAQGFRNPIAVRCLPGHDTCFALELALDYSTGGGGREKLVPIRTGDDWGFPCCATQGVAYDTSPAGTNCAAVTPENVSWLIGDTPFGLAFAPSTWPGMWSGSAIVTTHGAAGSWVGARVVAIAMDPTTGMPVPGTDNFTPEHDEGSMTDFATGWDDGTLTHGRPAAVEFSADGRLFIANDNNGVIFWIAPLGG
jgi:glucose/arabinose dehydrogenase